VLLAKDPADEAEKLTEDDDAAMVEAEPDHPKKSPD
jgi:hypothetical protein